MRLVNKIAILFIMLLCVQNLAAQNSQDEELEKLLNENPSIEDLLKVKVVSASKKPQQIMLAPANIIVVDREKIKNRGYRNLSELLNDLPGFHVASGQPSGEYPTHIMVRGMGDVGQTKLLILVDGIEQNEISSHWAQNLGYNFAFLDVARVEIISGPGSTLYGADAYAGIVNIITRSSSSIFSGRENGLVLDTAIYYGLYNTFSPEILIGYTWGSNNALWLTGRWYYSEGDRGLGRYDPGNYFHKNYEPETVTTTEYGDMVNQNPDGSAIRLPNGFDTGLNDYYIRGKYVADNFEVGWNWWLREEGLGSEVVGYEYFAASPNIPFRAQHMGYTIYTQQTLDFTSEFSSKTRLIYRGSAILPGTRFVYTYKYQSVDDGTNRTKNKKKNYHGEGSSIGLEQQFDIAISEDNELITGFLLERNVQQYYGIGLGQGQSTDSSIVSSTYSDEKQSVTPVYYSYEAGVFLQDEHKFSENYILTGGGRFDYNTDYGYSINPRASFVAVPNKMIGMKFLYGEAFKAPSAFELYDEWRGNTRLEPEKIRTAETEVNFYITQTMLFKVNIFHSRLENLITVVPNPNVSSAKTNIYQNTGKTNYSGVSAGVDFEIFKNFRLFGHYTYTIGKDLAYEIYGMPSHKVFMGVNYFFFEKLNINFTGIWYGQTKAPRTALYYYPKTAQTISDVGYNYVTEKNPDGYLEEFFVFNLTLTGKNIFKNTQIEPQIVIKNLFNTKYATMGRQSADGVRPVNSQQSSIQNPNGFIPPYHPQPGIELLFGLRYSM
ncbi:MAG: TonB-dependent receptor [Leptospirales bacterium]